MNRKFFISALSVLFLGGTAAFAEDKPMEKTVEKKITTTSGTTKSKDHILVGTVKEFEVGKKIKVRVGKKTHTFTLDSKSVETTVEPSVTVGTKVRIVESKDANGIKTLSIDPAS
jgi:sRNA-binding protein